MGFEGLLQFIAEKFAAEQVRYGLIGGIALHAAGYSRATGDVDLLIHRDDSAKVKQILAAQKYLLAYESEDVLNFSSPWQIIGGVDAIKAHRHYALAMLERVSFVEVAQGLRMPVVGVADIIGLKVQALVNDPARRAKDVADIEWLLYHYPDSDRCLIREYFRLFSMEAELDRIEAGIKDAQ